MIFRARNSVSHGGVTRGFPLELVVENFVTKEVPFNPDLLKHMFPKIEWKALHDAAKKMDENDLPEQADASMLENDDFLHRFRVFSFRIAPRRRCPDLP